MKDDRLISFNAAIDALNKRWRTCIIGESLIRDAKDTLKALPSATDTNVGGNLIDRQAALDAIKKLEKPAPTAQHLSAIFDCEDTIKALPSAQPTGTNTVQVEDCISRAAVLDEIHKYMEERDYTIGTLYDNICEMPSAQSVNIAKMQPNCNQVASDCASDCASHCASDCISRAAIVDAIEGVDWYHMTDSGEMVHGANSAEDQPWYKAEDIYAAIEALPSAQRWIPWDKKTRNSMKYTLQTLYRLAYNIHGVMDAIDDDNVKRLIALLEGGQDE